jgi:MFS family permease
MPHVRRAMLTTFDAPPSPVRRALVDALHLEPDADGTFAGACSGMPDTTAVLRASVDPDHDAARTTVRFEAVSEARVPFFGWFVALQSWLAAQSELRFAVARTSAALAGEPAPEPPRRSALLPPVAFSPEQATRLASISAVAVVANLCGALLTQNGDSVIQTFGENDQALGLALAVARAGVLVSLVAVALADRIGRRRMLLLGLVGACCANALAAVAPSFAFFVVAQLLTRAFTNAMIVVAGVAAVEEAPEGARAFAVAMFGLALGVGFGLSVVFLPLADLGNYGWRISFGLSAAAVLLVPALGRHLRETSRYARLAERRVPRGRVRDVFDRSYGARFLLLGLAAFLTNVFSAPSSQLTNRYLTKDHSFSHSDVALFRSVTAGVPGVVGVLLAGRLAESRGRRPVGVVGVVIATLFQMAFFVGGGAVLWIAPTIAIVAAACAGLALGTLDAELFPTEVRSTSNGFLLVCGVAGSAAGLVLATQLKGAVGGLGPGIAVCGVASLLAGVFVVPRLPETVARSLDDVSPSEA